MERRRDRSRASDEQRLRGPSLPSITSIESLEVELRDYMGRENDWHTNEEDQRFADRSGPYASVAQNEHNETARDRHVSPPLHSDLKSTHPSARPEHNIRIKDHRKSRSFNLGRAAAFWTDTWVAEILSCLLAVLTLIGLTVTLRVFQGKPLAEYKLGISLNTVVAVFSAVLKASLLMPVGEAISQLKWLWFTYTQPLLDIVDFDLASRGPWGSILLLIRLHSVHLASIGAWITIAALAIDPFSQQIIQYYPCQHNMSSLVAEIPRVNNFTEAAAGKLAVNGSLLDSFANLDQGMSAAVYMGLLNPPKNASQNVNFLCSTGNCTFPFNPSDGATYQSLGFGTECKDITSETEKTSQPASEETYFLDSNAQELVDAYKLDGYDDMVKLVDFMAGTSGSFSVVASVNANTTGAEGDYMVQWNMIMMNIDWKKCEDHGSDPAMILECVPPTKPFAVQCTLYPKLQTFNASVANGVLDERVIAEERLAQIDYPDYPGDAQVSLFPWTKIANRTLRRGQWHDCTPSSSSSTNASIRALSDRLPAFPTDSEDEQKWYPQDCVWAIDDASNGALIQFLLPLFRTSTLNLTWADKGISFNGDPWILNLYNNGTANVTTVERYFRGLEDAMSAYIRTWGNNGKSGLGAYAQGEAYIMQTCIAVEWGWISFPAILTFMSVVFLGLTYWRTAREKSGVGSWKSFTLADLFSGLDEGIRGRYGKIDRKSEMQDVAGELRVRLVLTDGGWRLKEVKEWREDEDDES